MGDLNGATVTISGKEPNTDPVFTGDISTITQLVVFCLGEKGATLTGGSFLF